jgi:hypothetical protein
MPRNDDAPGVDLHPALRGSGVVRRRCVLRRAELVATWAWLLLRVSGQPRGSLSHDGRDRCCACGYFCDDRTTAALAPLSGLRGVRRSGRCGSGCQRPSRLAVPVDVGSGHLAVGISGRRRDRLAPVRATTALRRSRDPDRLGRPRWTGARSAGGHVARRQDERALFSRSDAFLSQASTARPPATLATAQIGRKRPLRFTPPKRPRSGRAVHRGARALGPQAGARAHA